MSLSYQSYTGNAEIRRKASRTNILCGLSAVHAFFSRHFFPLCTPSVVIPRFRSHPPDPQTTTYNHYSNNYFAGRNVEIWSLYLPQNCGACHTSVGRGRASHVRTTGVPPAKQIAPAASMYPSAWGSMMAGSSWTTFAAGISAQAPSSLHSICNCIHA